MLQDAPILSRVRWAYLMVDEAHRLKNNESALYQVPALLTALARCHASAKNVQLPKSCWPDLRQLRRSGMTSAGFHGQGMAPHAQSADQIPVKMRNGRYTVPIHSSIQCTI